MITSYAQLKEAVPSINPEIEDIINKCGIRLTPHYLSLIDINNPEDPLYKLVIPSTKENNVRPEELLDPIGDNSAELHTKKTSMLVHRYPDRALILTNNKCACYCRYCFRKEVVFNKDSVYDTTELGKSLEYIKNTTGLKEVILSGGDPMMMPRDGFWRIFDFIRDNCPHIKTVRIHSRAVVYDPELITEDFAERLNSYNKHFVLVFMTHIVHANEIKNDVFKTHIARLNMLKTNQAVLLKGVNDTFQDQADLSYALIEAGIMPHYLHYLDMAQGISHFRTTIKDSRVLMQQLRGHISGHLIPKLILDVPGGTGKIQLEDTFIEREWEEEDGMHYLIRSTHTDSKYEYIEQRV